jgi:outer membrane protein
MKRSFTWMALAIGAAFLPATASAQTLNQALASAYKNSGLLQQNQALLRSVDENVAQATAALRPILNWSATVQRQWSSSTAASASLSSYSASDSKNIGISASLLLYDFGASQLAKQAAEQAVKAAQMSLISAEQAVLQRAVTAYLNAYQAEQTLALRQSNVRLIQEELRAAQDRFEVGEVTRTDVALAQARLAAAVSLLAVAKGDLDIAGEEYAAAIGQKPSALALPGSIPKTATTVAQARAEAVKYHPRLKEVQINVAVADLNYERARVAMKPTLNMSAQAQLQNAPTPGGSSNIDSRSGSVSLGLSGPIYQGGRLKSLQRQAGATRDAERAALHVARTEVEQKIGNALAYLEIARASYQASDQQVKASQLAFEGVREEAKLGSRTTLDVLNAEQELLDARTGRIGARIDEYSAAYGMLAATGRLTARSLGLNVPLYDPNVNFNAVKNAPVLSPESKRLKSVLQAIGIE